MLKGHGKARRVFLEDEMRMQSQNCQDNVGLDETAHGKDPDEYAHHKPARKADKHGKTRKGGVPDSSTASADKSNKRKHEYESNTGRRRRHQKPTL